MSGCCKESLSAYLDGELSPEDARGIEIHLKSCASCRETLNRLQTLSSSVRQAPRPTADPLLAARVLSRLQLPKVYSEIPLIKLLESWGMLSLVALGVAAILFGPVVLGMLYVIYKHLATATALVVKLSWQLPLGKTNLALGLVFMVGAIAAFYGFGRLYSALSREGLIS